MRKVELIRWQIKFCESEGVTILCCPEAVLGGLADNAQEPDDLAIDAGGDRLAGVLAPLASKTVTTIVGFTEIAAGGRLFNSAAVLRDGVVVGLSRKHHPAINRSVYRGGDRIPVFEVGGLTFGVIICNDSNFVEPARTMVSKGASALIVPTNNGLPPNRAGLEVVARARQVDVARAREDGVSVIRADVSGRAGGLLSYGCSEIVDAGGAVPGRRRRSPKRCWSPISSPHHVAVLTNAEFRIKGPNPPLHLTAAASLDSKVQYLAGRRGG